MRNRTFIRLSIAAALLAFTAVHAEDDVLQRALRDELDRSMRKLQLEDLEQPYFISYLVREVKSKNSSGTFGSLLNSGEGHSRQLHVEVRVGDYALDNTNFRSFSFGRTGVVHMWGGNVGLPLEDDYDELRRSIWLATDGAYKKALEDLARKRASLQNKTRTEEIPDFSREEPAIEVEEAPPAVLDLDLLDERVRQLSGLFREMPDIHTSRVSFNGSNTSVRYLNSEGSSFTRASSSLVFTAVAATQAPDGMPLEDFVAGYARTPGELPGDGELAARIDSMGERLKQLRQAPLVERYTGPVIFSGQAATELFNQGFVPYLLASRRTLSDTPGHFPQKKENPFLDKIGVRVLPEFLGVRAEPLMDAYRKQPLFGGYGVDDEGVPARQVHLVRKGVLETLLTTRTPVRGIDQSTGSRRGPGVAPSNVLIEAKKGASEKKIRKEFLKLVKRQKKQFGYIVTHIGNPSYKAGESRVIFYSSGSGNDEKKLENPIFAYRVYLDGREELVRNAEFAGIGLYTFKDIVKVSGTHAVNTVPFRPEDNSNPFGGGRGSEVPVSIVSPRMVLFEDITLKPPSGEIPKAPVSMHPYFDR